MDMENCNFPSDSVIILDEVCPEPRKESNPPVFRTGDWVISSSGRIDKIIHANYELPGYYLESGEYFSGSWCSLHRLWSLWDVESGSALVDNKGTFLVVNRLLMPDRLEIRCVLSRNPDTRIDISSLHPVSIAQCKILKEALNKVGITLI